MRKTFLLTTTAVVAVMAFALTAEAGGRTAKDTRDAEIQELKARLDRLEQQSAEDQRANQDAAVQEQSRLLKIEKTPMTIANGRPCFNTADNSFSACFRARLHLDAVDYFQNRSDFNPGTPLNVEDLANGVSFRRAYFGLEGRFMTDWEYEIRLNFAGSGVENAGFSAANNGAQWINLARVAYRGIPNFKVNFGAIEPLFTLADSTSSNELPFMERASVVAAVLGPFGGDDARKGFELTYQKVGTFWPSDNLLVSGAFTASRTGQAHNDTTAGQNDEQTALLGRIADRIYSDPETNIQIGASASHVFNFPANPTVLVPPGAVPTVSFADFPEVRMNSTQLIGTGNIAADSATLVGLEAVATFRNFYVGGEYYTWKVDGAGVAGCAINTSTCERGLSPKFSGYYFEGSWVITGEFKGYDAAHASLQSPKPDHPFDPIHGTGWGAFELLARYSDINLNWHEGNQTQLDATVAALGGVRGGEQKITTLGLNWYLNNNLRFMFDYEMVDVDRLGNPVAQPTGVPAICVVPGTVSCQAGQKLSIFGTRASFAF